MERQNALQIDKQGETWIAWLATRSSWISKLAKFISTHLGFTHHHHHSHHHTAHHHHHHGA